jgi:hypothetical protein
MVFLNEKPLDLLPCYLLILGNVLNLGITMNTSKLFSNPFRPGAGHMPPYLAGRKKESAAFEELLKQEVILTNLVLTGLRGIGKTVLLDTFKPLAQARNWSWTGTDLSESTSISEANLATRLLTDISIITSSLAIATIQARQSVLFKTKQKRFST